MSDREIFSLQILEFEAMGVCSGVGWEDNLIGGSGREVGSNFVDGN